MIWYIYRQKYFILRWQYILCCPTKYCFLYVLLLTLNQPDISFGKFTEKKSDFSVCIPCFAPNFLLCSHPPFLPPSVFSTHLCIRFELTVTSPLAISLSLSYFRRLHPVEKCRKIQILYSVMTCQVSNLVTNLSRQHTGRFSPHRILALYNRTSEFHA